MHTRHRSCFGTPVWSCSGRRFEISCYMSLQSSALYMWMQASASKCKQVLKTRILAVCVSVLSWMTRLRRKYTHDCHSLCLMRSRLKWSMSMQTATHCNTLQYTPTHCDALRPKWSMPMHTATHCKTLQHTGTHRNTLQRECSMWMQSMEALDAHTPAHLQGTSWSVRGHTHLKCACRMRWASWSVCQVREGALPLRNSSSCVCTRVHQLVKDSSW